MPAGDAQFWVQQFIGDNGTPRDSVNVTCYAAGTTTLKDVWVDAAKTTPSENPVIGDAHGFVYFYGDGEYRLRVTTSDNQLLYDWDNVYLSADRATVWENDRGTAYPGASTKNQGQLFAKLDSTNAVQALAINDTGTSFQEIPATLKSVLRANLPSAGNTGWLRRQIDGIRGVWLDTGEQWTHLGREVVNVKEFNAKGDNVTNDTAALQAAADAVNAAGGGQLYFPPGTYIAEQFTIGSNTWVRGATAGSSIIKNTQSQLTKGIITNRDPINGNSNLRVSDLTLTRTVAVTGANGNFNELLYFKKCTNVRIDHCRGVGAAVANWSDKGFHCESCTFVQMTDNYMFKIGDNPLCISTAGTGAAVFGLIARNWIEYGGTHTGSSVVNTGSDVVIVENIGIGFSAASTIVNLVEVGDGCSDVIVADNLALDMGLLIALSGNRILVSRNLCRGLANGVAFDNTDPTLTAQANMTGHVISQNTFINGAGITLKKGTNRTFDSCVIEENVIRNGGSIVYAGPSDVIIRGNRIHKSNNMGLYITSGGNLIVADNTVSNSGSGTPTDASQEAGFYFEGGRPSATQPGWIVRNRAYNCKGYGFLIEQPQFWNFVDNDGWNNTGTTTPSGSIATTDKVLLINNVTLGGAIPFQYLRHRGPGSPASFIHASPGSFWHRTDDGNASPYFKNSGTGNAGWSLITSTAA